MSSTTAIPLIEPAKGVTEDMIRHLVETFYDRVLQDEELGPIFRQALSHRWSEHLAIMVDFWSSIALRTGRYQGKPQVAHRGMALLEGHFERWLALFEATAREVCEPDVAQFFIDRAHRIADSLQIGLNIGSKAQRSRLEHFSAKWIRFAVRKCVKARREMIPRKWRHL